MKTSSKLEGQKLTLVKIERKRSDLISPPSHHREALTGRDEREA